MSLLSIIQNACRELSLNQPNAVVSSSDKQILQLLSFANKAGREIMRTPVKDVGWSFLQNTFNFQTNFVQRTATAIAGSNILTLADTTGITVGYGVISDNLPAYSIVTAVTPTTVTLDNYQSALQSGSSDYNFSQFTYTLPSDYDSLIPDTYYQLGDTVWWTAQISPQDAQFIRSRNGLAVGINNRFRIKGNQIIVDPYPSTNVNYSLLYRSNAYVIDGENGNTKQSFTKDEDTTLLDDDLLEKLIIVKFKSSQGLSYDEEYQDYRRLLDMLVARDGGGSPDLSLGGNNYSYPFLGYRNIPEGNYGI